jgi:S1-C subfamily serine protease
VPATSPAARAGMRAGDRILRIDSKEVFSPDEIRRAVESSKSRRLTIDLLRKGRQMRIEVRL